MKFEILRDLLGQRLIVHSDNAAHCVCVAWIFEDDIIFWKSRLIFGGFRLLVEPEVLNCVGGRDSTAWLNYVALTDGRAASRQARHRALVPSLRGRAPLSHPLRRSSL
jgi:hypothetical protein